MINELMLSFHKLLNEFSNNLATYYLNLYIR